MLAAQVAGAPDLLSGADDACPLCSLVGPVSRSNSRHQLVSPRDDRGRARSSLLRLRSTRARSAEAVFDALASVFKAHGFRLLEMEPACFQLFSEWKSPIVGRTGKHQNVLLLRAAFRSVAARGAACLGDAMRGHFLATILLGRASSRCQKRPMPSVTLWRARAGKSGKACGTSSGRRHRRLCASLPVHVVGQQAHGEDVSGGLLPESGNGPVIAPSRSAPHHFFTDS